MHQFIILCLFRGAEETDLIYEGIETKNKSIVFSEFVRKKPT